MKYYDRIGISERIDPTKSNRSKECKICRFCNYGFKFQDSVSNVCHDLLILSLNIINIGIITIAIIVALFITLADLKQLIY